MVDPDYGAAGVPIRDDLRRVHGFFLEHVRAPGTWWSAAQRLAIAAAARAAVSCKLCRERKAAVSPNAVDGKHDGSTDLPEHVIDVIHRIRTDPARLSKAWFDGVIAAGLDVADYVELVAVVTMMAGIDSFARALGIDPLPLAEPLPGQPSRRRPRAAKGGTAWVPMIAPEEADGPEADLYGGAAYVPNIVRALSLVPQEVRVLRRMSAAHYLDVADIGNVSVHRALDRMQMELVAARVSALNECFY